MKKYCDFLDRQTLPPERFLQLAEAEPRRKGSLRFVRPAAAVCALLLVCGAALAVVLNRPEFPETVPGAAPEGESFTATNVDLPVSEGASADRPAGDPSGSGTESVKDKPVLTYLSANEISEAGASICLPEGAFDIALPDGSFFTDASGVGIEQLFPAYSVSGRAVYDGSGDLWMLYVWGTAAEENVSFELELAVGHMPPQCCVAIPEDTVKNVIDGTEVTAWWDRYEWEDGRTEYVCRAEFMAGKYGIRFENRNAPYEREYPGIQPYAPDGEPDLKLGGTMSVNNDFVDFVLGGGLDLEDLLRNDNIPAWREEQYDSLAKAREEAAFAPYLPAEELPGRWTERSFYLSYQEGTRNYLGASWYGSGSSSLNLNVHLPEGDGAVFSEYPVDIDVPESYDVRLYDIPWYDSVPEPYQPFFYSPTFRAEDMSLETVRARETRNEQEGSQYTFQVLFENGVQIYYNAWGLSPEELWSVIEPAVTQ